MQFICTKMCKDNSVRTKILIHMIRHGRLASSVMNLKLTQLTAVSLESFQKAQCTCEVLMQQLKRRWQRWRSMCRCGFSTSLSGTWIWAWCTTDWARTWRNGWFFSKTSSKGRVISWLARDSLEFQGCSFEITRPAHWQAQLLAFYHWLLHSLLKCVFMCKLVTSLMLISSLLWGSSILED